MGISFVQQNITPTVAMPTVTSTLNGVVAGDSLILVCNNAFSSQPNLNSFADSNSQTWTLLEQTDAYGYPFQQSSIYWLPSSLGGNVTVTLTYNNSGTWVSGVWLAEFSGISGLDGAGIYLQAQSQSPYGTTAVPSAIDDLAVVVYDSILWGPSTQPGSPWTNVTAGPMRIAYQVLTATTAVTGNWTTTATAAKQYWWSFSQLFGPAAAAPKGFIPPRRSQTAVHRAANYFKRESGLWSPESGLIPRAA